MWNKLDKIKELETKADGAVSFVDDFIQTLEDAREDAEILEEEVNENISRLKKIVSKTNRVKIFTNKILKSV